MNRNFHNLRGFSVHAGNQNSRWRTVFIALVLVLAIGSAGQTPAAQAAPPAATEVGFFMLANKERPGQVCVGELVLINVLVYRYKVIDGVSQSPDTVTGVAVSGHVDNPDIGQLLPSTNTTIWASSIYPGAADFVFTAEKPGNTTITFDALVATRGWFGSKYGGSAWRVSAPPVDVQVIPCLFKVSTISTWVHEAKIFTVVATSDALIKIESFENYTGTGVVRWTLTHIGLPPCTFSATVPPPSQVDWTVKRAVNGRQFVATGNFQPVKFETRLVCPTSDTGSLPVQMPPGPLSFTLTLSGGFFKMPHPLVGGTIGSATIVVIPQAGIAAEFVPGNQQASWDDFLDLFDALLFLH